MISSLAPKEYTLAVSKKLTPSSMARLKNGRASSSFSAHSQRSVEPGQFDILRDPNPHLGYGGLGTHYCLGASLAKLEIELIFNTIADAMPDIAKAGDPVRLRSGWINGIKSLPVTYRP